MVKEMKKRNDSEPMVCSLIIFALFLLMFRVCDREVLEDELSMRGEDQWFPDTFFFPLAYHRLAKLDLER